MSRLNTIYLDPASWDLTLDTAGNIALAQPPYALAQDVASAIRLFRGELWYDTTAGVPHWEEILGHLPPRAVLIQRIEDAAKRVPGVVSARLIVDSLTNRTVTGRLLFIDELGIENQVNF